MIKSILICLLIVIVSIMLPACDNDSPGETTLPETTEFGRMMGFIPYSFLEKYDIFYGNLGQAKELYGVPDVDSLEIFNQLQPEQRDNFINAWNEVAGTIPTWNSQAQSVEDGFASLTGFDVFSFDRTITINNAPPAISYMAQGDFDEELIAARLTEQGYTKTDYGDYSYYGIRDDFEIDLMSPVGQLLAALNRVAAFDNTLITSPATEYVTGIFDTMAGDAASIIDNNVCRALIDSLGEALQAAITTPERIIFDREHVSATGIFDFTIPDSWGQLHEYEMAAFGYRVDGDKRYFDIALYYADKNNAAADGKEIAGRMSSYSLNTWGGNPEKIPFTERYLPGGPEVTEYGEGAVLKIPCQLIPEGRSGANMLMGYMSIRDLLFLAVDPEEYTVK